ncbi:unnamed protein product [Protopolystoma xenopodis]|uniref:Uncharacterized protein n=1 Tax=Protopolystoma xenopodis TaxID=117903 RepID=A0A3S5A7K2_9PLAT|nr:unnamed protein product [Protopolystoma xenopodis]
MTPLDRSGIRLFDLVDCPPRSSRKRINYTKRVKREVTKLETLSTSQPSNLKSCDDLFDHLEFDPKPSHQAQRFKSSRKAAKKAARRLHYEIQKTHNEALVSDEVMMPKNV